MAETTIVPFSTLPACATECYHLYDANGACVPPAVSTAAVATYAECFCSNSYVSPFSTGTSGVCDSACTTVSGGLASIHTWFSSFCSVNAAEIAATTGTATGTSASSSGTGTSNGTSSETHSNKSVGQAWLASHKQWVAFIVIVVVGIAGIWIGAAMWRRRYLRKRDRQYALGKDLAQRSSTVPNGSTPGEQSQADVHHSQHGMFAPGNPNIDNAYDSEKTQSGRNGRRRA